MYGILKSTHVSGNHLSESHVNTTMGTMIITYDAKCKHCAWAQRWGRGHSTTCGNRRSEHYTIKLSDPACDKFSLTKGTEQ